MENNEIYNAKKVLETISQDERERRLTELREKYRMDQHDIMLAGYDKGLKAGIEQTEEKIFKIANKLLTLGMPIKQIMEVTGLNKEEIDKIESEILTTVLKENFSLDNFYSQKQISAIKSILNTQNIFYISSPGSNQNLIYEYCSLLFNGLTIVISPVLPNITQNITSLPPCLKAAAITAFTTPSQKKEIYSAIKSEILNILYINPERFVLEKIDELKNFNIALICLEDISYSLPDSNHFRPLYINIINKIKMLKEDNDNKISLVLLSNYLTQIDKEKISEMYEIKKENIIEEEMSI